MQAHSKGHAGNPGVRKRRQGVGDSGGVTPTARSLSLQCRCLGSAAASAQSPPAPAAALVSIIPRLHTVCFC